MIEIELIFWFGLLFVEMFGSKIVNRLLVCHKLKFLHLIGWQKNIYGSFEVSDVSYERHEVHLF